jgi:MFS family permease
VVPAAAAAAAAAASAAAAPAPTEASPAAASVRLIVALVLGQLGMHAAMAGLRMAAPLQTLREGYSAWSVGVLLALFAAAPVVLALYAGRYADRHGYHRPVYLSAGLTIAGLACALASVWLTGWLHFALLCAGAMLSGTGSNMGMLTIQRAAGVLARDATERLRLFSWLGVAPSFANVLGPVAAGFAIDVGGFGWAYALLLALPLMSLLAARQVPRLPPRPATAGNGRTAWDLLRAPGMKRLLVVNWLLSMCWDVHTFAVPILGHERGFSATTIGLILGAFTLAVTGVRLLIPLMAHHLREITVLRSAMAVTAGVFALYPLAPTPALMGLCALVLGVALGSVQPMVMSLLHHITPDQRHGEALAFRSMAINASSTVMPLVFGAAGALTGAALMFWLVAVAVGSGSWAARRLANVARGPGH